MIASAKIDVIKGVSVGDVYENGSCHETLNLVPDGSGGLKQRNNVSACPVGRQMVMLDELNAWTESSMIELTPTGIKRETNAGGKLVLSGAYSVRGLKGVSIPIAPMRRTTKQDVAWLYVEQTPPSGIYEFRIRVDGTDYTVNVDVHGPDTVTEPAVNMSDIPTKIGTGDNVRANPDYEATYNIRTAQRDARLLQKRADATLAVQPHRLAQNITTRIQQAITGVGLYANFADSLVHLAHPLSVVVVSAPYWVRALNNGRGQASDLPPTGLEGYTYELGGGARYTYSATEGWKEVDGHTSSIAIIRTGSGAPVFARINYDPLDNTPIQLSTPATVTQSGNRVMIHTLTATVISTSTDDMLYGFLSHGKQSAADGLIYNKASNHAFLFDTGVLFTDDDGVILRAFGTDKVETIHVGDAKLSFVYQNSVFVVSQDRLIRKQRQTGEWVEGGSIRLPINPTKCFSTAEGVLLTDKKDVYLFNGDGIYGPQEFVGFEGTLYQGINRVSYFTSNHQSYSWGDGSKGMKQEPMQCRVVFRLPMPTRAYTPTSKYVISQWKVNHVPPAGVSIGSLYGNEVRFKRTFTGLWMHGAKHSIGGAYDRIKGVVVEKADPNSADFFVTTQSYTYYVFGSTQPSMWGQE